MVLATQQWSKIAKEFQNIVLSKVPKKGKCAKTSGMD
jgi:hypothetical protein